MIQHAVVIVGAGPTGLMLAGELALAKVDVAIVERRASQELAGMRAGGLHARTIELFDQRGIVDRFLVEGTKAQVARFAGATLDISDFPTRHNYGLALWQSHIERLLAQWVAEQNVPIYRGHEVTGAVQNEAGVDLDVSGGMSMRAQYVVGCDGGRSVIRKAAGIAFPGSEPTISNLIAEAEMRDEPRLGIFRDSIGTHSISRIDDSGRVRILVTEPQLSNAREPELQDLKAALVAAYGTDYGVHGLTWLSRFSDAIRQAAEYRRGRFLVAGDAAHVHPPDGGQGLQIGIQDAVNLGWKLARVVHRTSPESLLDTYHAERHSVAARVLRNAMGSIVLRREDDRTRALRDIFSELLAMDEPRKRFAAMMSGLDVHHDFGDGHPLLGRRMPDLDLVCAGQTLRVFALLKDARPLLINFCAPSRLDDVVLADEVRLVEATCDGVWELPALGMVSAPEAVLIRPDGYVAWVGEQGSAGLAEALRKWFG
ncbi:MAG: FAD-dependent monooxygenase [Burkholderia sp.]